MRSHADARAADLSIGPAQGAASAQAPEMAPSQPVHTYHYDAKMVCGFQPKREDLKLAGVSTAPRSISGIRTRPCWRWSFASNLAYPPGGVEAGEAIALDPVKLPPRTAAAVDCRAIEAVYFGYGFPAPVIEAMLGMVSLQPLEVTAVWSAATPAHGGGADELTSVDVDRITPYLVEAELGDPAWDPDAGPADRLCGSSARTSTVVTRRVDAITYAFDEAPGEGPREVVRVSDVQVLPATRGRRRTGRLVPRACGVALSGIARSSTSRRCRC